MIIPDSDKHYKDRSVFNKENPGFITFALVCAQCEYYQGLYCAKNKVKVWANEFCEHFTREDN